MKKELAVVAHARTGQIKTTRTGKVLVVDLNEMPARIIRKWEKQGFCFPLPMLVRS